MGRYKSGSEHPWWKGGKYIDKHSGYVYVLCRNHPRCTINGYVAEHILVMEKKLGRRLSTSDSVHHINKIKTDNRVENLRVYSKSQHSRIHTNPWNLIDYDPINLLETCYG